MAAKVFGAIFYFISFGTGLAAVVNYFTVDYNYGIAPNTTHYTEATFWMLATIACLITATGLIIYDLLSKKMKLIFETEKNIEENFKKGFEMSFDAIRNLQRSSK